LRNSFYPQKHLKDKLSNKSVQQNKPLEKKVSVDINGTNEGRILIKNGMGKSYEWNEKILY
jgi:hypothetical protein